VDLSRVNTGKKTQTYKSARKGKGGTQTTGDVFPKNLKGRENKAFCGSWGGKPATAKKRAKGWEWRAKKGERKSTVRLGAKLETKKKNVSKEKALWGTTGLEDHFTEKTRSGSWGATCFKGRKKKKKKNHNEKRGKPSWRAAGGQRRAL